MRGLAVRDYPLLVYHHLRMFWEPLLGYLFELDVHQTKTNLIRSGCIIPLVSLVAPGPSSSDRISLGLIRYLSRDSTPDSDCQESGHPNPTELRKSLGSSGTSPHNIVGADYNPEAMSTHVGKVSRPLPTALRRFCSRSLKDSSCL